MKSNLVKIGASTGIILPESFLEECFIKDEVIIELKGNQIIVSSPEYLPRRGWDEAFEEMAANGDDQLVIPELFEGKYILDWSA